MEEESDEEIEALEKRRSIHDDGVVFTRKGLVEFIDKMILEADPTQKGWKSQVDKSKNFEHHVWLKRDGIARAPGIFCFKGKVWWDKKFRMDRIVKSMY